MRRRLLAVSVTLLLPLAAACGDDEGDDAAAPPADPAATAPAPPTLTKEEFIAQGDAICRRTEEEAENAPEATDLASVVPVLDQTIVSFERARTDFAALVPPADGQAVKDALLASIDASLVQGRRARDAAAAGDQAGFDTSIVEAGTAATASDPAASAYGFVDCVDGGE